MTPILALYVVAALITALIAGVFLAFSDFVMRSLSAATPAAGIQSMQIINREVYSSIFLFLLLAMAPIALGLAGYAAAFIPGPAQPWLIAGGLIYFFGTFLVTVLGNVPMNRRLDPMAPDMAATQNYWRTYATFWTRWNHVRTGAATAASAAFLIGCVLYA
ncbi:MAG: anthrone oxygenase family protein [Pseudomonadota bacterium]